MGDESGRASTVPQDHLGTSAQASLRVHLLAGLPTEGVRRAFDRAHHTMPIVPLDALADIAVGDATRLGVLLPPFVEPSQIVESWEQCEFLPYRFGRPAHVAGISTFLDVDHLDDHLASADALSLRGWGRCDLDGRTVADIVVGQIESATQLVVVGGGRLTDALARRLEVLNPGASRVRLDGDSGPDPTELALALGWEAIADGLPEADTDAPRSVAVVPQWLELLRGERAPAPESNLLLYRRARPFDPARLSAWLAEPPAELVRGKGHVWLASAPDQSFGYSCAGTVHRLFEAGRWWASHASGTWPRCPTERRRLLERWHPRFGDRRQELVFLGVDLDPDRLFAGLDACLLPESALDCALAAARMQAPEPWTAPPTRLH